MIPAQRYNANSIARSSAAIPTSTSRDRRRLTALPVAA
jgi:hypothetical protein